MSKYLPDSCSENDPAAPGNDVEIKYTYKILIEIENIIFTSEVISDSVYISSSRIKDYNEYDVYMVIENEISEEIKEFDYKIELLNGSY